MDPNYQKALDFVQEIIDKQKEFESRRRQELEEENKINDDLSKGYPIIITEEDFDAEAINLAGFGLTELPKNIVEVKNLVELKLAENNLQTLPDWLQSKSTIKYLDLRNNDINEVPDWIFSFRAAEYVDCTEFPKPEPDQDGHLWGLLLFGNPFLENIKRIRIFISYSHYDNKLFYTFLKWIKAWRNSLKIEIIWNDQKLRTGDDWLEKIKLQIATSNVFIYLLSVSFFDSDFIRRYEVIPVLERFSKDKKTMLILPIYLKDCKSHLKQSKLKRFQHLPSDGKSVDDYERENMGDKIWDSIVESLEASINSKFQINLELEKF